MQATFNIESLPIRITYAGESTPWGDRLSDQWNVTISSAAGHYSTNYYTGTGLRKQGKPVRPTNADVLHSLFMDASASDFNFSDWCDEYGYSDDSLKALNTYKACLDIARALRKHLSPEQRAQIQEIIQDM